MKYIIGTLFTAAVALTCFISDSGAAYVAVERNFNFHFTPKQYQDGPKSDPKFFKLQQEFVDKELWSLVDSAYKARGDEEKATSYQRVWTAKAALARRAGFQSELNFDHAMWMYERDMARKKKARNNRISNMIRFFYFPLIICKWCSRNFFKFLNPLLSSKIFAKCRPPIK